MPNQSTWRLADRLVDQRFPLVMGILNVTPDSFYAPSRVALDNALVIAEQFLEQGARIIDVGGASSRPGADPIALDVELERVLPVISAIADRFPDALISIDTCNATVAEEAISHGARMVNDISAGLFDRKMFTVVANAGVPYVAMHKQGEPKTMQIAPMYTDIVPEVTRFLRCRAAAAHAAGIVDVILDPGFGFGKTTQHNYALLNSLECITALGLPVLVGVSRKRMINDVVRNTERSALNGTTVLNSVALMKGASILRVHDVIEAVEAVELLERVKGN